MVPDAYHLEAVSSGWQMCSGSKSRLLTTVGRSAACAALPPGEGQTILGM
jgi:hypothetical protein